MFTTYLIRPLFKPGPFISWRLRARLVCFADKPYSKVSPEEVVSISGMSPAEASVLYSDPERRDEFHRLFMDFVGRAVRRAFPDKEYRYLLDDMVLEGYHAFARCLKRGDRINNWQDYVWRAVHNACLSYLRREWQQRRIKGSLEDRGWVDSVEDQPGVPDSISLDGGKWDYVSSIAAGRHAITQRQDENPLDLLVRGESLDEIIAIAAGKGRRAEQNSQILEMWQAGWEWPEIRRKLGLSQQTFHARMEGFRKRLSAKGFK